MPGEFYFMALGGLGVSLAGFAGLIAALAQGPASRSAVAAWRIRNIVVGGFLVTFGGFGTVAAYTVADGDVVLTARITSLFFVVADAALLRVETRPGPAWPSERRRRFAIGTGLVRIVAFAVNVAAGSFALLQVLFLIQLMNPVSIFINTVREVARPASWGLTAGVDDGSAVSGATTHSEGRANVGVGAGGLYVALATRMHWTSCRPEGQGRPESSPQRRLIRRLLVSPRQRAATAQDCRTRRPGADDERRGYAPPSEHSPRQSASFAATLVRSDAKRAGAVLPNSRA